jgi:hypothetical protein
VISPWAFLRYALIAAAVCNMDAGALALIWPGPTHAKLIAFAALAFVLAVVAGKGCPYQQYHIQREEL